MDGRDDYQSSMVAGAALESRTLLGRVVRMSVSHTDPRIAEMFSNLERQTKRDVEGKVQNLRHQLMTAHSLTAEFVLALLKAGGHAKDMAIKWLSQALRYNTEATKDRVNPLIASSSHFLINLGALMLRLCRPFMLSQEKLAKVDWDFLNSTASTTVFPADCARLIADSESKAPEVVDKPDFNFITQSFFMCWRALHLGLVQVATKHSRLHMMLRHTQSMMQGNPQAAAHFQRLLTEKFAIESAVLMPEFVQDCLNFVAAASTALVNHLNAGRSESEAATGNVTGHASST